MSLTRRSFIKKSSYSAAAVTVLGTGVALAQQTTSATKKVTDYMDVTALSLTKSKKSGEGATTQEAIEDAKHNARQFLLASKYKNPPTVSIVTKDKTVPSNYKLTGTSSSAIPPGNVDGVTYGPPTVGSVQRTVDGQTVTVYIAVIEITMQTGTSTRITYTYGP